MRVFVAGATGVLGRRVVPLLIGSGHQVTAVARTPEAAERLRSAGAVACPVDLFDSAAVATAVAGHDVVCNLATHIPSLTAAARPGAWAENDRLRIDASRNLVDAALAAGAARYIQESIAFRYADGGDRWLDEDAPVEAVNITRSVDAAEAAAARFTDAGRTGVVLRFAVFYGADTTHTRDQLRAAAAGIAPAVGRPDAYQSMIHLDDAATAVVAALTVAAGTYNVAEDQPGTRAEVSAAIADALGRAPGAFAPAWLTRAGGASAVALGRSIRVSNRRFRDASGWAPAYPGPWEGWRRVVAASPRRRPPGPGRILFTRAALVFLAINAALIGVWAAAAPQSFYGSFPGLGLHWVDVDGPFNEHLTRDAGSFMLALLVLTVAAAFSHRQSLVRVAGVAWFVSALPHFLYHLFNREVYGAGDQIASIGGLALQWMLGLALVALAPPSPAVVLPPRPSAAPAMVGAR